MAWFSQVLFGRLFEYLGYIFYNLKFEGLEHLKECDLPVIFVCNHKSWIDHFIIISGALRIKGMVPIHVLVADDIWALPIIGAICKVLGAYPACYGQGLDISLQPLLKDLAKGECVGLYPEGGIERGFNKFREPKPGAAWLALKTGRQILPMAIKGLEEFSWRSLFFGRRQVTIRFGKPFALNGDYLDAGTVAANSSKIMSEIINLYRLIGIG